MVGMRVVSLVDALVWLQAVLTVQKSAASMALSLDASRVAMLERLWAEC
jgi:hypothetical protein